MFENLLREIKNLDGQKVSVPIETDEDGYMDKECPSDSCMFKFKVNEEDWKNIFRDEAVYCPLCRHEAKAESWWTTEQVEKAKRQAIRYVEGRIGRAMDTDARTFNRKQPRNSFIKMSMKASGFSRSTFILPIQATELMELKIKCEKCNSRFSVIGSAYFCPSCGFNSVERTFDDSIKKIFSKIENADIIRKAFTEIGKKDEGEVTIRSLIESALSDGVTAYQRLAERLYEKIPAAPKVPFNAFQRLDAGSDLWKQTCGKGYEEWLDKTELRDLKILFQKRHILAHNEGIVDDKYIKRSGDSTYNIGQRIVVTGLDIRRLVDLIGKLAAEIRAVTRK
jgi:Zn finger protein HypA/HybF involved in hydrogenase expression